MDETIQSNNLTFLLSKSLINEGLGNVYGGDRMPEVQITKMSSKGQIVIPQEFRDEMGLKEGEAFAAVMSGDTILLKKIEKPSREKIISDWESVTAKARKDIKKLGIKQKDVSKIIHRARGVKE